jgi:thioredoxin-related protein
MFGGDWCGWCHKLHGLVTSDRTIARTLGDEYVLVMIDTGSPRADDLIKTCKAALSEEEQKKGIGYPFLAVLDAEGKVVKAQQTDSLEEGDHHNPAKVQEFLNAWKIPPKDAKLVLEEALSHASSDDKRVLLSFGAPWCGWCHRLHDWMAQPEIAAILDRDFVIAQVDVDRMIGGKDVQKNYQPATSAGIPWFAILDAKGKSLATSDGPSGNIGYPAAPQEIKHFLSMVKTQGRRIDDGQLDQLKKSLEDAAVKLKQPTAH